MVGCTQCHILENMAYNQIIMNTQIHIGQGHVQKVVLRDNAQNQQLQQIIGTVQNQHVQNQHLIGTVQYQHVQNQDLNLNLKYLSQSIVI